MTTATKKQNLSLDQESYQAWIDNFHAVSESPETATTQNLIRAIGFAQKAVMAEGRKPSPDKYLITSMTSDIEYFKKIISNREAKVDEANQGAEALPLSVKSNIENAIAAIKNFNRQIHIGRDMDARFGGEGRYEVDTWINLGSKATNSLEIIEKYRKFAPQNHVDFDLALNQLGFESPIDLSISAQEWMNQ